MTTEQFFTISDGPPKYDIMMSFFEKKELNFRINPRDRIQSVTKFIINGLQEGQQANSYYMQVLVTAGNNEMVEDNQFYFADYNYVSRYGILKSRLLEFDNFDSFFFNLKISDSYPLNPLKNSEIHDFLHFNNYDWVEDGVIQSISNISIAGMNRSGSYDSCLFDFKYDITPKRATKKMSDQQLWPANILDLLLLGEQHPEVQEKYFPIIALESVCLNKDNQECYLCLSFDQHVGSQLCLVPIKDVLIGGHYNYLAVSERNA